MNRTNSIRVLVVDDHPVVRQGLVALLKTEPGMEVVGEASDGIEAVEQFRIHQPDVTLMDLRLPRMSGVGAIATIRQEFPSARIILLTTYDGEEDIYRGLQAGAKGYLLKDTSCDEILDAIRAVHQGQKYLPVTVGGKLAERMESPQLSERECEVLRLLAQGKSNQEIAKALGITEGPLSSISTKFCPSWESAIGLKQLLLLSGAGSLARKVCWLCLSHCYLIKS